MARFFIDMYKEEIFFLPGVGGIGGETGGENGSGISSPNPAASFLTLSSFLLCLCKLVFRACECRYCSEPGAALFF